MTSPNWKSLEPASSRLSSRFLSWIECRSPFGFDRTIVFYNDSETFHWKRPEHQLCDARTGVICSPNNYTYETEEGELPDGVIRITHARESRPLVRTFRVNVSGRESTRV